MTPLARPGPRPHNGPYPVGLMTGASEVPGHAALFTSATLSMASATVAPSPPKKKKRIWAPHMWQGCDFFAWMRLLVRNRFAVHWSLWYVAIIVTFVSVLHTVLRWVQDAIFGRAIRKTQITQPPIFIVGHWRTGTTFLHELLILDPRHGYPTTYECFEPNHFLLTEWFVTRFLWFLLPAQRGMDNVKSGFDRPQEDEFALCMLGEGSPYLTVAFPNRPPQGQEYLDLEGLTPGQVSSWKRTLKQFLKRITYKTGKRLVLKSPPHTGRIKVLRELFPGAAFIHIVRDPYVVFPSTINLWQYMYRNHGLQMPTFAGLEDQILTTYERMYERLEQAKASLDPRQFFEMRYEDLTPDPEAMMRRVYDHFGWGDWEAYVPRLRAYLATVKGYETNKYALTPEQRDLVGRRCAAVIERSRLRALLGGGLPAWRDVHVRQPQEPLDAGPFAHVVAFAEMADVLQNVAADKGAGAPQPLLIAQQHDAGHRQRNADHVDPEVEGVPMARKPVAHGMAQEAQQRTAFERIANRVLSGVHGTPWSAGRAMLHHDQGARNNLAVNMQHSYAVIWDVDGTLVDTAELHFQAWCTLAREIGKPFTRADFAGTFGWRNPEIIPKLFGLGGDAEIAALGDRKELYYREEAAKGVALLPGVRPLDGRPRRGRLSARHRLQRPASQHRPHPGADRHRPTRPGDCFHGRHAPRQTGSGGVPARRPAPGGAAGAVPGH